MADQHNADRFVGAHIEREGQFDAQQYSFFADLPAANGVAAEALEDGLEAPPDEDALLVGGLGDELEPGGLQEAEGPEDYTVAGMFSEPAHGGIRWRTEAGSPGADLLDENTDLEAVMARSLPKHMFGDDEEGLPSRPQQQQPAQATPPMAARPGGLFGPPQPVSSHALTLTPAHMQDQTPRLFAGPDGLNPLPQQPQQAPAAKATPMTLAELEAQMAADSRAHATPPPPQQQQQQGAPHVRQMGFNPGMPQGPPPPHPQMAGAPGMHYPPIAPHGQPPYSHPLHTPPAGHMAGHMQPGAPPPPPGMHHGPPPPGMHGPPGFMHGPGHHMQPGQMPPPGAPLIQPPAGPGGVRAPLMHHHMPPPPGMMMMGPRPGPPPGHGPLTPPPPHMQSHHMGPPGMQGAPRMPSPYGGHTPPPHQQGPPAHGGPSPAGMVSAPLFHPSGPRPDHPMGGLPRAPMMLAPMGHSPHMGMGMGGLQRPRLAGAWMAASEVEHVMSIMYAAVHTGVPYVEDYYYQAFVNQVTNGRNTPTFRPEFLRSLRVDVLRLDPALAVRHAAVEGLGKIVLSNIRTPKMLMDLTSAASDTSSSAPATTQPTAPHRPLEQEPILAARIMVEDCHDKLLDIDDIDRCCTAAAATGRPDQLPDNPDALRQRRALLATSIINAFRLPAQPSGGASDAASGAAPHGLPSSSDAVFLNLMTLPKGRSMLGRSIRVLLARTTPQLPGPGSSTGSAAAGQLPAAAASSHKRSEDGGGQQPHPDSPALASPEQLLWAVLRNFHQVWGASISDPDVKPAPLAALVESSHKLAAAARDALHHLSSQQQVVDALSALVTGLQARNAVATAPHASPMESLLPLAQVRKLSSALPDSTPSEWLGEVLVALLQRGLQLMPDEDEEQMEKLVHGNGAPPASAAGGGSAAGSLVQLASSWREGVGLLVTSFSRHVAALTALQQEMSKQAALKGVPAAPEAVQAVRSLACRPLAQQLLGCIQDVGTAEQLKQQLRALL